MIVRIPKAKKKAEMNQREFCITQRFRDNSLRKTVITLRYEEHASPKASSQKQQIPKVAQPPVDINAQMTSIKKRRLLNNSLQDDRMLTPARLRQQQLKYTAKINNNLKKIIDRRSESINSEYVPDEYFRYEGGGKGKTMTPREDRHARQLLPRVHRGDTLDSTDRIGRRYNADVFKAAQPRIMYQSKKLFNLQAVSSRDWHMLP